MGADGKLLILAHEASWEKRFQVSSLAASEAAAGRSVDLALFFSALRSWVEDGWDRPQPTTTIDPDRLSALGMPPLSELLADGRDSGRIRVFACSASARILDLGTDRVQPRVDAILGWQSFARMIRDAHRVVTF